MISEFNQTECFVYITLPGETMPVTAGKFVIQPDMSGLPLGSFVYGKSYLGRSDKAPIDPVELKLSERIYETRALKGMLSALTLLRAEDTHASRGKWSYPALAEELRRLSASPREDAEELFRRMCFNALISNIDDHPRNHAVIAREHDWRLSPAYDLTPFTPISIERRDLAMICGDGGRRLT